MADRVDVKLKAKDPNNETTTTTISYVNPEASNSAMKQFAQKLNALTRNTYSESDKIETTNLDTAPDSGQQTPTLTLVAETTTITALNSRNSNGNYSEAGAPQDVAITYTGDGKLRASVNSSKVFVSIGLVNTTQRLLIWQFGTLTASDTCTITVTADATTNYKAAEVTFTIT